jgi:2-polyprenyl-6-methoxyphenol hydroxylase-like FAD-dependent oxidoreductase
MGSVSPDLRIAIVGGGLAGLPLARLLQINNISCAVFELDNESLERDQGGTLDLHARGGQIVLKNAGLLDEFKKYARPEGEAMKLIKHDGTVVLDENTEGSKRPREYADRPEIDRTKLRQIWLDSLKPGTVRWGKKLQAVHKSSQKGKYDLQFQDSREEGFDLVVGADGAWSKVRSYLSNQLPFYSGVTMIELWATEVDKRHKSVADYVGAGQCFMFDEGRAIQTQKLGNNALRVYAGVRQPEDWAETCGIDWARPDEARQELVKQYFSDCSPELREMILDSSDNLKIRKIYMLPVGWRWESSPGVTLVGDAAHLMTPFAGVGVNVAMVDSLDLAQAIIGCNGVRSKLPEAIAKYDKEMLERAIPFAQRSAKGLVGHFSKDGCEEMASRIKGR